MRKYAIPIGFAAGILCVLALIGVYFGVNYYTKQQAPTLSLVTATMTEVVPTPITRATTIVEPTLAPTEVPTEIPTAVPATPTEAPKVCGQSGTWVVLFLGRTIHLDPAPAQMIRLWKVDFDHKTSVMYSFPPDLVIETPGLVPEYRIQTSRLQDIFTALVIAHGESADTSFKATQATAQAILDNFGIAANHYITFKEDMLMKVIDSLGGIYVNLPKDFTLPDYSKYPGMVLKAGVQRLDGEMTHDFVTYRENTLDEFNRLSNQNAVLQGMRKKILDPSVYLKIPELYSIYKDNVTTDLSLEQIVSLSCLIRDVPLEEISIVTPSKDKFVINPDGSMYMINSAVIVDQIQSLFAAP